MDRLLLSHVDLVEEDETPSEGSDWQAFFLVFLGFESFDPRGLPGSLALGFHVRS